MSAAPRRFRDAVARFGDTLTVNGTDRKAVVTILTRGFAYSLMAAADVDAATRPMRLAFVAGTDSAAAGQSASWNGESFTVKKVVSLRLRNETVAKMLALG